MKIANIYKQFNPAGNEFLEGEYIEIEISADEKNVYIKTREEMLTLPLEIFFGILKINKRKQL